ncbi:MAG: response regulator transcription factor [Acutalibacteraceae bacterium]|nr:response regulator transcription factor [Acutalibacteraceae bacterium]
MRLLLAEDEKMLSDALVALLTHSHYSVDAVGDGEEALDYLMNGDYDGAILDIMMPKMDGLTVLRKIRAAGMNLPVLMLTAKSEIDDRVEGLDAGADDYLTKPFASRELLARIRAMTRRQPELSDSELNFADVKLDRAGFLLTGPDGSTNLNNKEFQLMETFLLNPTRVISTDQLFEKIWGYDTESEINVVWVTISNLRKKLKSTGSRVQIRATRNVGYSLEEPK